MLSHAALHVRQAIHTRMYPLTSHAEREREADTITIVELEEAFGSDAVELLELYSDDPRGPSGLFLGFTNHQRPIHAVIGLSDPGVIVFITLYRPDPVLWYDWRRRVGQQ